MNVGHRIIDRYGQRGVVTRVLNGLDEACQYGLLGPSSDFAKLRQDDTPERHAVTRWLDAQELVPRTPRAGTWLVVSFDDGGEGIVGVDDATEE